MTKKIVPILITIYIFSVVFQACISTSNIDSYNQNISGEPGQYPTKYPDRIVATWKKDPATSLSVTWRTDTTVKNSQAHIAPATAAPKFYRKADTFAAEVSSLSSEKVEREHVKANYHTVTLEGLKPNTLYAYKVGHNDHWSEWFHVRTAAKTSEPFQFIYFGDAQNDIFSHWSRDIREAYREAPRADFIIHAGDLVNNGHSNLEWGRWNRAGGFIQSMIPSIAVPGNHEYEGYTEELDEKDIENLSIHWRKQFEFPKNGPQGLEETCYYIDYQGMRILALNSNEKIEEQQEWMENILKDNNKNWIVATHHHPIYSTAEGRNNEDLRNAWQPIYEKYGVDLVMQGHDHTYGRGQMKNLSQGANGQDSSGTVYVNSVSGAKMYDIRESGWKPLNGELQRWGENTQLYQIIKVTPDTLKFRAYTATGELYDAFDLVQQEGKKANKLIEHSVITKRTYKNTILYEK